MPPTSVVLLSPENTRVKRGDYRGDKFCFAISLFECPRVMDGSRRAAEVPNFHVMRKVEMEGCCLD